MTKLTTLNEAFLVKLQALYDVETELTKALPQMTEAATDQDLKDAFNKHMAETEKHVENLEEAFKLLKHKPSKVEVEAIRGLINDAKWCIEQEPMSAVLDSMLIGAASYIEHYEIAGYTTATNWANMLGLMEVEDLLSEILTEEELAAEALASLAEEKIDSAAMAVEEM